MKKIIFFLLLLFFSADVLNAFILKISSNLLNNNFCAAQYTTSKGNKVTINFKKSKQNKKNSQQLNKANDNLEAKRREEEELCEIENMVNNEMPFPTINIAKEKLEDLEELISDEFEENTNIIPPSIAQKLMPQKLRKRSLSQPNSINKQPLATNVEEIKKSSSGEKLNNLEDSCTEFTYQKKLRLKKINQLLITINNPQHNKQWIFYFNNDQLTQNATYYIMIGLEQNIENNKFEYSCKLLKTENSSKNELENEIPSIILPAFKVLKPIWNQ